MKKLVLLILLFISFGSFGQRHIKGISGIDIGLGTTTKGLYVKGAYVHYLKNNLYFKGELIFDHSKIKDEIGNKYNDNATYLNGILSYTTITSNSYFFNLIGGVSLGADLKPKTFYTNSKLHGLVGITGGIENEVYITDKFALLLTAQQYYYPLTSWGKFRTQIGIGTRIIF